MVPPAPVRCLCMIPYDMRSEAGEKSSCALPPMELDLSFYQVAARLIIASSFHWTHQKCNNQPIGGISIVGGDFAQILPIVKNSGGPKVGLKQSP